MIVTKRELDETDRRIIELLTEGKIYKEIAYKLGVSIRHIHYRLKVMRDYYNCTTVPALIHKLSQDSENTDCSKY